MGLDSVELVMSWEEYFSISIPDREAEKINTVQDAVNCIARHCQLNQNTSTIKFEIQNKLISAIQELKNDRKLIYENQLIFEIIPFKDYTSWQFISKSIGLKLPLAIENTFLNNVIKKVFPARINPSQTDISRFTDLICAVNYNQILTKGPSKNEYEILIAIMGISIEKLGLDPFEVFPDKSFVNDFGID